MRTDYIQDKYEHWFHEPRKSTFKEKVFIVIAVVCFYILAGLTLYKIFF